MKPKVSKKTIKKEPKKAGLTAPLFDMKGKEVGEISLSEKIFGLKENKALVAQAIRVYLANQRGRGGVTKTRSQVAGGGAKPWRQKGTGRARAGSIRSPLWRGGGIVHGPGGRDFGLDLPKKMRQKALLSALSAKVKAQEVTILNKLELAEPKTKLAGQVIKNLDLKGKVFVVGENEEILKRAFSNLARVELGDFRNINTYDVVSHESLLFTKGSLEKLEEHLTKNGK
jgi:large subunit ribosomal protein L4